MQKHKLGLNVWLNGRALALRAQDLGSIHSTAKNNNNNNLIKN